MWQSHIVKKSNRALARALLEKAKAERGQSVGGGRFGVPKQVTFCSDIGAV